MSDRVQHEAIEEEAAALESDELSYPQIREAFCALERKHRKLFEAMHDMRFVVAQDGRLVDVNEAGVEIFGYSSREEMLDLGPMSCLYCAPEDREGLLGRIAEDGFVRDYLVEMKKKDGSRFLACITAGLWSEENGTISYEGILRDVSEQRKWQNALIESIRVNRELKESEEQYRELIKHTHQMLAIMSHDIRGPLVAIAATLKLLIRGTYGRMDESVANTVRDLLTRVAKLLGMTEEYLGKVQSVESGLQTESETLDLRQDIIDPVLDEISSDIEQNHITIDNRLGAIPAGKVLFSVNKIWLKAVFRNLFKNAIKYGGRGCRIAFGFEDHGAYYRLNVYNSGSPIPEEHREKLFTRFGRVGRDGPDAPDGMGLGLFLIKEIIRKHGGDIWYEARPDGSDFVLTLAKERT